MFLVIILLLIWITMIYYLGTSGFGRDGTQDIIDLFTANPKFHGKLNQYHGTVRAVFHYIQFGGLYFFLYLTFNWGSFTWVIWKGFLVLAICCGAAWLDEWHQSRQPGRKARKIDLLHSCLGASFVHIVIFIVSLFKG